MVEKRKDFSCTPEPAVVQLDPKHPEPSASFEATPPPASMAAKPPQARVFDVISEVAREVAKPVKG